MQRFDVNKGETDQYFGMHHAVKTRLPALRLSSVSAGSQPGSVGSLSSLLETDFATGKPEQEACHSASDVHHIRERVG